MLKENAARTPSFSAPPIVEVSFGLQFKELPDFKSVHFGQLWQSMFKDSFPQVEDTAPVPSSEELGMQLMTLPPLRRVFLKSSDGSELIQLQNNRFFFNWRKSDTQEYPRFSVLFPKFRSLLALFADFVKTSALGALEPHRFELAYVNYIDVPDHNFASALEENIKLLKWTDIQSTHLAPPNTATGSWQFDLPRNIGQMSASLNHIRDNRAKSYIAFILACASTSAKLDELEEWFHIAHEAIVFGFDELTTENAHGRWGKLV